MKFVLRKHTGFIIIASLFFIAGILRLNDLSLYTDCTRYLIWGNSIAHGKGFVDDTQPTPEYFIVNAPLYSVILAPALLFFPISLSAAKVWTLLWGIFALLLFYHWIRNHVGQAPAFAATLFLALNPLTLVLSTEVLSETSFLAALFGIVILLEHLDSDKAPRWLSIMIVIILSVMGLLREIGVSAVIAATVFLFIRKQWRIAALSAAGAFFLFTLWAYRNIGIAGTPDAAQSSNIIFIFRHFVTSADTSILHEMVQRISMNFKGYAAGLSGLLLYSFPFTLIVNPSAVFEGIVTLLHSIRFFISTVFLLTIVIGIVADFKTSRTALLRLVFLVLYLGIVLIYPVQDIRFLFPILPFAIFYLIVSFRKAFGHIHLSHSIKSATVPVILTIILLPNIVCIYEIVQTNISYCRDPIHFSATSADSSSQAEYYSTPWKSIGRWIDLEIPAGSVIVTPYKEIAPFAPKHKFLEVNAAVPLPLFESKVRDNIADYLIAPLAFDSIAEHQAIIDESERYNFVMLRNFSRINIYRIESRLENQGLDAGIVAYSSDTANPLYAFRSGRFALAHEKYSEAVSIFSKLYKRYPYRANILYQLLLTSTFIPDSVMAGDYLQKLYSSPNSTSYIAPAQAHIRAMHMLLRAQSVHDILKRAEQFYELGRLYWKLGYPRQAYNMMKHTIELDTTFFVGYLWAWHYGIQIGDTVQATRYLNKLKYIDPNNTIVDSYQKITRYYEHLRNTIDRDKRSKIHLAISHEYDAIGLYDEALDEAQRAIGENPANADIWYHLADLFKKRNCYIAGEKALEKASELETNPAIHSDVSDTQK